MKRGNIDQRWSVPGGLSGLGGTGAKLSRRDLFSCRRLAVECIVFGALVLWFGLLCFFIAERYDRCAANSAATPASGTFVNIRAWVGQLYWQEAEQPQAGIGIEVGVSRAKPSDATWHIEPHDDSGWFCLRHVPTLRLLEAVPLSASAGGKPRRGHCGCSRRRCPVVNTPFCLGQAPRCGWCGTGATTRRSASDTRASHCTARRRPRTSTCAN